MIEAGRRRGAARTCAPSIPAEAALLAAPGCVDLWLPGAGRTRRLACGLSFLMGLQDAFVARISNARVRTTHVTGMITDIGIEPGSLASLALHRARPGEAAYGGGKLRPHGVAVASFLGGGVAGVLACRAPGAGLLFAVAGLLLVPAAAGLMRRREAGKQG